MPTNPALFISCASDEFRPLRKRADFYLRRRGCEVKTQEHFRQWGETTLEKLDLYLQDCQAAVHLIGERVGSEARPEAVKMYLEKHPDFLSQHPEVRASLGDCSGLSYTQWEAYIALHHGVTLHTYLPEGVTLTGKQKEHLERLASLAKNRDSFTDETDFIGKLMGDLGDIIPDTAVVPNNLPPSIGTLFKGREAWMERIRSALGEGATAVTATKQTLYGLGGVGKTRLAIEYGHQERERYSALLFLAADSKQKLEDALANLTGPLVLDLPEHAATEQQVRVQAALRWLSTHTNWFLILDNVDDEDALQAVEALLGTLDQGHVLITSRRSDWSPLVTPLDLDVLDEEASVALLLERSSQGKGRRVTDTDEADARKLAKDLDGLALALEQAGAFMATHRTSITKYHERWRAEEAKVREWFDARQMHYPASVATTWQTSFDQLSESGRLLLEIFSCYAPDPIPRALIETEEAAEIVPHDLEDAMLDLERHSFIRDAEVDAFLVHRLVQGLVQQRLPEAQQAGVMSKAMALADVYVPPGNDPLNWTTWDAFQNHAKRLVGHETSPSPPPTLLDACASYLQLRQGGYRDAEPLYRRALEARERTLGPEDPSTLTSVNNLANLLDSTGRYEEAEPLCRRALEARERTLGPEHPSTLIGVNSLALLLNSTGRYEEAEPLYRRALEARERTLGPEHPSTLTSVNNLAHLLESTGRFEEAEPLYQRAVQGIDHLSTRVGQEHPNLAPFAANYRRCLEAIGYDAEEQEWRVAAALHVDSASE